MTEVAISDFPVEPPTCFERKTEPRSPDPWLADLRNLDSGPIGAGTGAPVSSSSCLGTLKKISLLWQVPTHTASWISRIERCIDILHAQERTASVNIYDAPENLFELRRLTGFTWTHLASLLNVDRRTLNNWVKGAKIREQNRLHIAEALKVLRFADRGSAELNFAGLNKQDARHKLSPFEAIQAGYYELAKQWLSHGLSRPNRWQVTTDTTPQIGEFQPIVIHADADGTEIIEPLTDEPEPVSRKRQIRHS